MGNYVKRPDNLEVVNYRGFTVTSDVLQQKRTVCCVMYRKNTDISHGIIVFSFKYFRNDSDRLMIEARKVPFERSVMADDDENFGLGVAKAEAKARKIMESWLKQLADFTGAYDKSVEIRNQDKTEVNYNDLVAVTKELLMSRGTQLYAHEHDDYLDASMYGMMRMIDAEIDLDIKSRKAVCVDNSCGYEDVLVAGYTYDVTDIEDGMVSVNINGKRYEIFADRFSR